MTSKGSKTVRFSFEKLLKADIHKPHIQWKKISSSLSAVVETFTDAISYNSAASIYALYGQAALGILWFLLEWLHSTSTVSF